MAEDTAPGRLVKVRISCAVPPQKYSAPLSLHAKKISRHPQDALNAPSRTRRSPRDHGHPLSDLPRPRGTGRRSYHLHPRGGAVSLGECVRPSDQESRRRNKGLKPIAHGSVYPRSGRDGHPSPCCQRRRHRSTRRTRPGSPREIATGPSVRRSKTRRHALGCKCLCQGSGVWGKRRRHRPHIPAKHARRSDWRQAFPCDANCGLLWTHWPQRSRSLGCNIAYVSSTCRMRRGH